MVSIAHPMIMSFDGMAHFLHQRLMKVQRKLELRGFINQAIKLFFEKVVKKIFKGWVQSHCIPFVTFVQLAMLDLVERSQAFRCRSPWCFQLFPVRQLFLLSQVPSCGGTMLLQVRAISGNPEP